MRPVSFEAADQGADDIVLDGRNGREVVGSEIGHHISEVEMEVLVRPRRLEQADHLRKVIAVTARTLQPIGGHRS